jgi:hypothetical protein
MTGHRMRAAASLVRGGLLISTLTAIACDRGDSGAKHTTQCARFCAALEKCDDATDVQDCEDGCTADQVHSDAYFKARADCGEKLSCNVWASEVDSQGAPRCEGDCDLVDCVDDVLAKVKLSQPEVQACTSVSTKLDACDPSLDEDESQRSCTRATPLLSRLYLDESQLCVEQKCSEINGCLDDLADEYGTELRLFSGKLSPR